MVAGSVQAGHREFDADSPRLAGTSQQRFRNAVLASAGALGLLLGSVSSTHAAAIHGRVLDESTLTPLSSANVRAESDSVKGAPVRLVTNGKGEFGHADLPAGRYRVTVSFVGYSTAVIDSLMLEEGHDDTLTVALVSRAIDMDAVVVSVSRHPETYEAAPSAVVTKDGSELQRTAALSHTDQLKQLPGVDAASTGINSSNVVVRGFNNVLSTTLLSLVDHRITQVPSLRVNAYQLSTTIDEDIERLELVMGPGAALYGPNTSSGVLHLITRSPFSSSGGQITLGGGEQDVALGSVRWATTDHRLLGFRASGQYYRGTDWAYYDPEEPESLTLFRQGPNGPEYDDAPIDNRRDFEVEKYSGDVRGDLLLGRHGVMTLSSGMSTISNIQLTDFGAAQVRDWRYGYVQLQTNYRDFFAQVYVNLTHAGDSYFRRTGARIIDRSKLYVTEVQHRWDPWRFLDLTYGVDAQFTRPETEGTLHGGNEQRDDITSVGGYVQGDLAISSRLHALAALRLDRDNVLDNSVPSPRLAAIYHAGENQTLRVAYNRAFSTPGTADLFLDILAYSEPFPDPDLDSVFGPTLRDFRVAGSVDGFHFYRGAGSRPMMVSLYDSLLTADDSTFAPNGYLAPDVNSVWPGMRLYLVGLDSSMDAILPDSLSKQVPGQAVARELNGVDHPVDVESIQDVQPLKETTTASLEAGYKGRIGKRFAVSADVYYTEKTDFIGPQQTITPHVWIDSASFVDTLSYDIRVKTGDSVLAQVTANAVYDSLKAIPIGLISPVESQSATDVLVSRRNFGKIDVMGLDVAATFHLSPSFDVSGSYSYISEDLFKQLDGISDVATNAPMHKASGSLQYQSRGQRLGGQIRVRWVDGFPVRSGYYVGEVKSYLDVGLDLSYRFFNQTRLLLSVQNVFDVHHAEFVGSPELERLAIVRLSQSW